MNKGLIPDIKNISTPQGKLHQKDETEQYAETRVTRAAIMNIIIIVPIVCPHHML